MAPSLADRIGLGNGRAVANAAQGALRRQADDRLVADLVAALVRHGHLDDPSLVDDRREGPRIAADAAA